VKVFLKTRDEVERLREANRRVAQILDEVEQAWSLVTPILEAWTAAPPVDFPNYEAGTWGPAAAKALIERDGRRWRRL
jgi:glucose-6-phosphate 1-dehydrogenase